LHPDFLSAARGIEDSSVWKEGAAKKVAHILRAVSLHVLHRIGIIGVCITRE
jgi:hypothetical protein